MKPRKLGKAKVNQLIQIRKSWTEKVKELQQKGGSYLHLSEESKEFYSRRTAMTKVFPEGSAMDVNPDHILQFFHKGKTRFYRKLRNTGAYVFWYETDFHPSHQKRYARMTTETEVYLSLEHYLDNVEHARDRRKRKREFETLSKTIRIRNRIHAKQELKKWWKILDRDRLVERMSMATRGIGKAIDKRVLGDSGNNTLFMKQGAMCSDALRREMMSRGMTRSDMEIYLARRKGPALYQQMMGRMSALQTESRIKREADMVYNKSTCRFEEVPVKELGGLDGDD